MAKPKRLPLGERITDTGKALMAHAQALFDEAALEPDSNVRARIISTANTTIRTALLADRAEVDKMAHADATKLQQDDDRAARLMDLDA